MPKKFHPSNSKDLDTTAVQRLLLLNIPIWSGAVVGVEAIKIKLPKANVISQDYLFQKKDHKDRQVDLFFGHKVVQHFPQIFGLCLGNIFEVKDKWLIIALFLGTYTTL